jgi:hypothetical protein
MFIFSATQIGVRNLLLEIRFTKPEFVGWTHGSRTCATIPLVCWSSKLRAEGCVVQFTRCDFQRPWADTSHYLTYHCILLHPLLYPYPPSLESSPFLGCSGNTQLHRSESVFKWYCQFLYKKFRRWFTISTSSATNSKWNPGQCYMAIKTPRWGTLSKVLSVTKAIPLKNHQQNTSVPKTTCGERRVPVTGWIICMN